MRRVIRRRLARIRSWWARTINREPKPCYCNACTGRWPVHNYSPHVSHGIRMMVGKDGAMHIWAHSRIVRD